METSDPDDAMTLAVLADHPGAELVGVTLTPGGRDQVGLVRHVLRKLGKDCVRIGTGDPDRTRPSVSAFHDAWIGKFEGEADGPAEDVLDGTLERWPDAVLLTGAPLKNLGRWLRRGPARTFRRWVCQGGFAGDRMTDPRDRLEKFAGRDTCPTFNLNGDPGAAFAMLRSGAEDRILVSKNVCHGVAWDAAFHERVAKLPRRTKGMDLVVRGMELYLRKSPEGKKLHDPLAMAVMLDETVCGLRPAVVFRSRGEWGTRPAEEGPPEGDREAGPVRISVSVDRERFFGTLTAWQHRAEDR